MDELMNLSGQSFVGYSVIKMWHSVSNVNLLPAETQSSEVIYYALNNSENRKDT
jgi:hypothetical protein